MRRYWFFYTLGLATGLFMQEYDYPYRYYVWGIGLLICCVGIIAAYALHDERKKE